VILDSMNQRILALLKIDARRSASAIGREVGLSRTSVQDRIKKLESSGTIRGYQVITADLSHEVVCALIFVKIASRPCDQALHWLVKLKGVKEVHSLSGHWDAVVRVSVASTEELTLLNDEIGRNDFVNECISQVILKSL